MKTIVITGVTSGIGKALVHHFVQQGNSVIGVARNSERLKTLETDLDHHNYKGTFVSVVADLASFKSLQEGVRTIKSYLHAGTLDVLINNAAIVPKQRKITEDGYELQYQVNHLSVVFLTLELIDYLQAARGKVLVTGSDAHKRARFVYDDLDGLKRYHALRSYCRTKLYNVMTTEYLKAQYNLSFYTVHPGRVKTEIGTKDTSRFYAFMWRLFTRKGYLPDETVDTFDWLINEDIKSGYYHQKAPRKSLPIAKNQKAQKYLFNETLKALNPYLTKP